MRRILVVLILLVGLTSVSLAGGKDRRHRPVKLQEGDELNLGFGLTYMSPSSAHLHLDIRPISTAYGLGAKFSFGMEIDKLVRFESYSLAGDLLLNFGGQDRWYAMVGWQHAAEYTSAYSNNRPISYWTGLTAGGSLDLWRPDWLPNDRITFTGSWWFSKTVSVWMQEPPPRKIVLTLTYFFL